MAMLASTRWSPHSGVRSAPLMSSRRASAGSPCIVMPRYTKPLSPHSADTNLGSVTNGVVMVTPFAGSTHTAGGGIRMGSERPSAGRYGWRKAEPPDGEAGLVHAAFHPGCAERPNRLFDGGGAVARKDA